MKAKDRIWKKGLGKEEEEHSNISWAQAEIGQKKIKPQENFT